MVRIGRLPTANQTRVLGNKFDMISVANPARLETYGSPFVGWEKVTVDPDDPKLFNVEPMLQAIVR